MKIFIGTKNPGKIQGAKESFEMYFENIEIEGFEVESEVSEQPIDDETYQGAKNRVTNLKRLAKEQGKVADYYIAIESGLVNMFGKHFIINIAVIEDDKNFSSYGASAGFPIPEKFVNEIKEIGLGNFMDKFFFVDKERHNGKGGISLLTRDKISRIDLNRQAFIMALVEAINNGWSD